MTIVVFPRLLGAHRLGVFLSELENCAEVWPSQVLPLCALHETTIDMIADAGSSVAYKYLAMRIGIPSILKAIYSSAHLPHLQNSSEFPNRQYRSINFR
jgi:hypothetical protein